MPFIIFAYLGLAWYLSWWPFNDTERAIEASQYNVYFYYPDDREVFVGEADGLEMCRNTARGYAYGRNMIQSDWNYICCRITSSSNCASKHR